MGLYYDLPIYRASYQLVLAVYKLVRNFKKEYKYTLGQEMKHSAMQMVLYIFRANSAVDKREDLRTLSDYLEYLKLQLRLCVDMRLITPAQHAEMWEQMGVIGKQLTGWRKASEGVKG
jgi:four helix bundle protein